VDRFWEQIDEQLYLLTTATTADEVCTILATEHNPYNDPHITSAPAFFAGSGGDRTPVTSLRQAGWRMRWAEARYLWCMEAPDGSVITYQEGDIYPRDLQAALV